MRFLGLAMLACVASLSALPGAARAQAAAPAPGVEGLDADWDGALEAGGTRLRLVFHIRTAPGASSTLDSLDQNANGIPVAQVTRTGDKVSMTIPAVHGTFDGTLSADGQTIKGEWVQGPPLPLVLTRRAAGAPPPAAAAAPKRPQTPLPPFPYREEQVSFPGGAASEPVRLAGTLTLPAGGKPVAVAILISGSGPNARNEEIAGHKLFLVIADYLTRRGVAVLRYDKRGVGASTGSYGKATSFDFAADAKAAVAYLRSRKDIDARRIGLIGHSEGGLIAPMVAADDPAIAFMVMMAGPGENGLQLLLQQGDLILKAGGATDAVIAAGDPTRKAMFEAARDEPDPGKREAAIRRVAAASGLFKDVSPASADAQIQVISTEWFRTFFSYDPVPTLARVRVPTLALNGALDLQVPPAENLPAIRKALAHNAKATVIELPGLNHLFQTATTGAPSEYGKIEETIAPAALRLIGDWILKQL